MISLRLQKTTKIFTNNHRAQARFCLYCKSLDAWAIEGNRKSAKTVCFWLRNDPIMQSVNKMREYFGKTNYTTSSRDID